MLTVEGLDAGYGEAQILFGVDLKVSEGEVVTLLGRNGMGKTTTVRSIMGLLAPKGGDIRFESRDVRGIAPEKIARCGIGLVRKAGRSSRRSRSAKTSSPPPRTD